MTTVAADAAQSQQIEAVMLAEQTFMSSGSDRPRLEGLTSLRFLAALQVILFHLKVERIVSGGPWWYQNFAGIGYIGVNFFFVLSGFILVYIYAAKDVYPGRFWKARFARIYPAYVLSLAVTAPFFFSALRHLNLPFFAWSERHLAFAALLTLCLLQAWIPQGALTWNPVCWSLSVEAFFYFLFPLLLRRTRTFSSRMLLWGIAIFSLISLGISVTYMLVHPDGAVKINSSEVTLLWKNVLSFNPLLRLPEFIVGMLTGLLFLRRKNNPAFGSICILGGSAVIALITALVGAIPNPLISAGFLSPAFAAIIFGVAQQPRWTRVLALRPLVLLGEASYSLYLLHSFVMTKALESTPYLPHEIRVAVCIAAAVGASLVSHEFVEEPARRWLRPRTRATTGLFTRPTDCRTIVLP
jgi:peptidoglycan/LPS O-acetylase OafA/YrhL